MECSLGLQLKRINLIVKSEFKTYPNFIRSPFIRFLENTFYTILKIPYRYFYSTL